MKEQYGSVETRVLHIVAANSNKLTTEKLKEILHQRKLCVVGVDIAKVPQILDKIAVQRNNKKWSLKKEIWVGDLQDFSLIIKYRIWLNFKSAKAFRSLN